MFNVYMGKRGGGREERKGRKRKCMLIGGEGKGRERNVAGW